MITRDVDPSAVADLASSPPRAALAAVIADELVLLPVRVALEAPDDAARSPRIVQVAEGGPNLTDRQVVVLADDGPQWFRLRALMVRGIAEASGHGSYRIVPRRIVAWDYGALREVPGPPTPSPRQALFSDSHEQRVVHPFLSPNLEAALGRSRVMVLASRSTKGTPFAVPLWFVPYRGRLYATTSASSWTARNVAAAPQVAVLLGGEGGAGGERIVVHGCARSVQGKPPPAVIAGLAWRYYLQPRFAVDELMHMRMWALRIRYYRQAHAAYIVITPQATAEYGMS